MYKPYLLVLNFIEHVSNLCCGRFKAFCFVLAPTEQIDIGILIGSAGQLDAKSFNIQKSTAVALLDDYKKGPADVAFSVATYAPDIVISFKAASATNLPDMIQNLAPSQNGVSLDRALAKVSKEMYHKGNKARSTAKQVLIIFIDGKISSPMKIKSALQKLKNDDVKIIVVAFGDGANMQDIDQIVESDDGLVVEPLKDVIVPHEPITDIINGMCYILMLILIGFHFTETEITLLWTGFSK